MKWRSVNEKPKIIGRYFALIEADSFYQTQICQAGFNLNENWEEHIGTVVAWLDPEVPEEFLQPKEPEKKPCPWCKCTNWILDSDTFESHFWFECKTNGCTSGPCRPTAAEAEAAIFERVK